VDSDQIDCASRPSRRLTAEDLTFAGILKEMCKNLALRYLEDANLSLSRIAWLLGYEITLDRLGRTPDLVGIYVVGGGITGVIPALREDPSAASRNLAVVGRGLMTETLAGLVDGVIKVVLSHPRRLSAGTLVEAMAQSTISNGGDSLVQRVVPFEIYTAENV
jgi:hypothetical protein